MNTMEFWSPVILSLRVSVLAGIVAFVCAIWAVWRMTIRKFPGLTVIETVFMLPLVLPPTVVGFLLLVIFGRRSWVGQVFEMFFHMPIVFTWGAAVIAAAVVAFPLAYQTIKTGFTSIDRDLLAVGRSMGASEFQLLRFVTLPLARRSLMTALILAFTRSLGEFGATLMLAGNIPGRTQTLPTAIYIAVDTNDLNTAWLWAGLMVLMSFLLLLCTRVAAERE
ncbi:molybdate ABC transporter permease subunit [Paenibacillus sp. SN-8-1]|uniref:molybdate ABC transporter permease subunit n=1 Tax=Paenibacillus sp. SN-8-1 TaxID=3435409 RepID=UPI003D9A386C